jgi:hypothetical protein
VEVLRKPSALQQLVELLFENLFTDGKSPAFGTTEPTRLCLIAVITVVLPATRIVPICAQPIATCGTHDGSRKEPQMVLW